MSEERIIEVEYADEMKDSYIDYAMSVIMGRALPDVRDGLKPVHRRILYAMRDLGLKPENPYKKSARVVGDVLGKYHPHGDSSVYEAMVKLSQDWGMNNALVDGQGNFGSIDGDGAAAMRYTEARLSKFAMNMLTGLEKDTVPFVDNFDATLKEPQILPSRIPHLLVNGVTGIAVGLTCSIPPHNLAEVIDAILAYIKKVNISVEELMKYVKGPDFPTGGIIVNKDDLLEIYKRGEGKVTIRAKMHVEDAKSGKNNIVITEIPFTSSGSKGVLIEKIISLIKEKKFPEITDIRDESNKEGIRIVIEVRRGVDTEKLIRKLYSKTKLQDNFNIQMNVLSNGRPELLNLKSIIEQFVMFQEEIVTKEYQYDLNKAGSRLEVLEGLITAIDIIDLIIAVIRGSKTDKDAKECLMNGLTDNIKFRVKGLEADAKKLSFTAVQAEAILNMPLRRLIGLELEKLIEERNDLIKKVEHYKMVLSDKKNLHKVIQDYLKNIKKEYGQERKTEIVTLEEENYQEPEVIEDLYVIIDKHYYVKAVLRETISQENLEDENILHFITTTTDDKIAFFMGDGRFYQLKVKDIPRARFKDKGEPIDNITEVDVINDRVLFVGSFNEVKNKQLAIITKKGYCKRSNISELDIKRSLTIFTKIEENDEIVSFFINNEYDFDESEMIVISKNGYALRFTMKQVSTFKKLSVGIISIKFGSENDEVVYATIKRDPNIKIKAQGKLLGTLQEKVIDLISIPKQNRNTKGKSILIEEISKIQEL